MTRPRAVDLLLGATVVTVLSVVVTSDQGQAGPVDPLAYVWALALGGLMLVRRTHPLLVLVLTTLGFFSYYVAGFPAIGVAVPIAAALYSAAEMGHVKAALATGFVVLTVSTAYRLGEGQDLAFVVGYELISHVTLILAVVSLGHAVRVGRRLRLRNEQVMRLVTRQEEMSADARLREERVLLARELHDSIGHSLAVAALYTDVARENASPADRQEALERVRASVSEAMDHLRRTVTILRGRASPSPQRPGLRQVPALAAAPEAAGYDVKMRLDHVEVCDDVGEVAFRVVQEAITNVLKHSSGDHLTVDISRAPSDIVEVAVWDDGVAGGSAVRVTQGHGLHGMEERVRSLGGSLQVQAGPRGWLVRAQLPTRGAT